MSKEITGQWVILLSDPGMAGYLHGGSYLFRHRRDPSIISKYEGYEGLQMANVHYVCRPHECTIIMSASLA